MSLTQIISGGQTGVDRGALDAAIELGIDHGGVCPRGRLAEDGIRDCLLSRGLGDVYKRQQLSLQTALSVSQSVTSSISSGFVRSKSKNGFRFLIHMR